LQKKIKTLKNLINHGNCETLFLADEALRTQYPSKEKISPPPVKYLKGADRYSLENNAIRCLETTREKCHAPIESVFGMYPSSSYVSSKSFPKWKSYSTCAMKNNFDPSPMTCRKENKHTSETRKHLSERNLANKENLISSCLRKKLQSRRKSKPLKTLSKQSNNIFVHYDASKGLRKTTHDENGDIIQSVEKTFQVFDFVETPPSQRSSKISEKRFGCLLHTIFYIHGHFSMSRKLIETLIERQGGAISRSLCPAVNLSPFYRIDILSFTLTIQVTHLLFNGDVSSSVFLKAQAMQVHIVDEYFLSAISSTIDEQQ